MLALMRHPMLLLLAFALLAASRTSAAQTVIHHCMGANGVPIFTDRPCASLGAVPANQAANAPTRRPVHGPRHCPLDASALRQRVAAAFRNHNANALAGLMLWRGYGSDAADALVQHLARLMRIPFLGVVAVPDPTRPASAASAWPPPFLPAPAATVPAPTGTPTLAINLGDPARPVLRFNTTRRDGCMWLEPPASAAPTRS